MRIFATSRPGGAALDEFIASRQGTLARLHIEAGDQRVRGDTRRYAQALLEPPEIAAALAESGRDAGAFVDELTTRSDGNLGYLAALGRAIDQALSHADRRSMLTELLGLKRLPDDTRELFAFFLRQVQNQASKTKFAVTDPQDGSLVFIASWPQLYRPILALLSVALEPLTLDHLHALTRTPAEREQVAEALEGLAQFLERIGAGYRLYHATLAAFLTAADTRNDAKTTDLWVDAEQEHRRVATALEGTGRLDEIWQNAGDPREDARRGYARQHYVAHLYLGADWDRLDAAIEQGAYGRGKLAFDPSTYLYARDLDFALRALTRGGLDEEARLARIPRLWAFKFLRCAMSSYADRLQPATFTALAAAGREREASDLAELVTDPFRRVRACLAIARVVTDEPDSRERARAAALRACETALHLEDPVRRPLLTEIQQVLWPLIPQPLPPGDPLFDTLLSLARRDAEPAEQAAVLAEIAYALGQRGDGEALGSLMQEVAAVVERMPAGGQKQQACYTLTLLASSFGDFAAADTAVEQITDSAMRIAALTQLASAQHAASSPVVAATVERLSSAISALGAEGSAGIEAAAARADQQRALGDPAAAHAVLAGALASLRADASARANIATVVLLAEALRAEEDRAGVAEAAAMLESTALAELEQLQRLPLARYTYSLDVSAAARALAGLDETGRALNVIRRMRYSERGDLLLDVVRSLLRQCRVADALAIVEEIEQALRQAPMRISTGQSSGIYPPDVEALLAIADQLATERDWPQALVVAQRLGPSAAGIEALSCLAVGRYVAGEADEAATLLRQVMDGVRTGDVRARRDEALGFNTELFVRARRFDDARSVTREIGEPWRQAEAQALVMKALIEAHDFDAAQQMLGEIRSGAEQARCLLSLLKEVRAVGGTPNRPVDNLSMIKMLRVARAYAEADDEMIPRAEALRSIALAHAELLTGAIDEAIGAMMSAVEALNRAPRVAFERTPWCDTAAAFAELGRWEIALKIATGLLDHDPPDGCYAHRDLAIVAAKSGDVERVKQLLGQVEAAVSSIAMMTPKRSDVLTVIAGEYALAGLLDDAHRVAAASDTPSEAMAWIAAALLDTGRAEDAAGVIGAAQADFSNFAREMLVGKLLNSGDVAQAATIAETITDAPTRAPRLMEVAQALLRAGRFEQARDLAARALEGLDAVRARDWQQQTALLADAVSIHAGLGDLPAARQLVEQHWLGARTQEELVWLMPLAGALVGRQPELPAKIHAAFGWVEQSLSPS